MSENKHWTYVLVMWREHDNAITGFDVFGLYSTKKEARIAKKWRKRGKRCYEGCDMYHMYNRCAIVKRILDYNVPFHRSKSGYRKYYFGDREQLEEGFSDYERNDD